MSSGAPLVSCKGVTFRYFESEAGVTDVNLDIYPGERIVLVGQNGSGKSTLLSLIGGKRKASQGTVTVLGRDAFDDTKLNDEVCLVGPPWPPEAYFCNTVNAVTSPYPDRERRDRIATELHLPLAASIDTMSSGEKRRVQILFGTRFPVKVFLLDECSTDLDVAERATVLRFIEEECRLRGCCAIYATHIMDGLDAWPTRVVVMTDGVMQRVVPREDFTAPLLTLAHRWLTGRDPDISFTVAAEPTQPADDVQPVVATDLFYKHVFRGLSLSVTAGSRTLLLGSNGSGKSTLLRLVAGKTFFPNTKGELKACGKLCWEDCSIAEHVAFCGDWWTKLPGGEMRVSELIRPPLTERAEYLRSILRIDITWDVRNISAGEQKRVQLLLMLQYPSRVILLDEATADLDIDQRYALLRILYEDSVERGVTVVYATHILESLGNWATDCVILDRTTGRLHSTLHQPFTIPDVISQLMALKAAEPFTL